MVSQNLESSEILVEKQFDEIKTAIKAKEGMKCLLRLQENQLAEEKSIRKYQKNLNPSAKEYNAFLVMILTNFNKKIGLFVPKKFECLVLFIDIFKKPFLLHLNVICV